MRSNNGCELSGLELLSAEAAHIPERTIGRKMVEPAQFRRGKEFHKLVQADFEKTNIDGEAATEAWISFERIKQATSKGGRADVLVTGLGDYVAIYEIKATDWNRIKPGNIKKNLWRHQHQLFKYVGKYVDVDEMDVCLGIIYPEPPKDPNLRASIESYLEEWGAPAYWFTEIRADRKC